MLGRTASAKAKCKTTNTPVYGNMIGVSISPMKDASNLASSDVENSVMLSLPTCSSEVAANCMCQGHE